MKYLVTIKKHTAMLTLCLGISLVPLAASGQTPTPGTGAVEQREEPHNYGWIGLLGLIGLAGLLRRRQKVDMVARSSTIR
jgi:LPXTG-motif cell wall-anchored protein